MSCVYGTPSNGSAPTGARRAQQLKLAADLEEKLRVISRAAPRHTAKVRRAAVRADELFDELGRTLGNDLADIFDQAVSIPDQAARLQ
jgi:hypothetical protein